MVKSISKKAFFGIVLAIVVVFTSIAIVVNLPRQDDTFEDRINQLLNEANVPSLAAGIIVNDSLVWANGFGEQPDLDTVYMIGSMTKMFTATAIMQLYDNNTLDLDTDINVYIPFSVRNPYYPSTPITIRYLLTHSSGISHADKPLWDHEADFINWANNNLGWNLTAWDPRPTLGEFLNGSLNPEGLYYKSENWMNFNPGTDWQYSNFGFLLLAYIVEELTNQSYTDYLQENVLNPLGMTSTGFNYTDFIGRNAIPHEQGDTGIIEGPIYNQLGIGDGGLRSTVSDIAKFLITHMNQGIYNNIQILKPQTVELMQTSQFSMSGYEFGGFTFSGYGLGWPLYTDNIIGHGGAVAGYFSDMVFKTEDNGKYGIVVMQNKGSSFVHDNYLIYEFFPSIINLLITEAARLYNT